MSGRGTSRHDVAAEVLRLYADGQPISRIVAALDVSKGTVCRVVREARTAGADLPARKFCARKRAVTPKLQRVAQLWRRGLKAPEIGRRLGMAPAAVHRAVKRLRAEGEPLPRRSVGAAAGNSTPKCTDIPQLRGAADPEAAFAARLAGGGHADMSFRHPAPVPRFAPPPAMGGGGCSLAGLQRADMV